MATKQKTKTYTVRIEWPVTYYCDTTVEASSIEEAASLAMEDPDYDNQRSYDCDGDSTVEGVCEGEEYRYEDREEIGGTAAAGGSDWNAALLAAAEAAVLRSIERQEAGEAGVMDDDVFTALTAAIHRFRKGGAA